MNNNKHLPYHRVTELLDRAVIERGYDYVYPEHEKRVFPHRDPNRKMCSYVRDDGTPSCIIGLIASYLGVTTEEMKRYEGRPGSFMLHDVGFDFSARTDRLLTDVQQRQDGGRPWGAAVDVAKAMTTP